MVRESAVETALKKACYENPLGMLKYLRLCRPNGNAMWQWRLWIENAFGIRGSILKWRAHREQNPSTFCLYGERTTFAWMQKNRCNLFGEAMQEVLADGRKAEALFSFPHPWPDVGTRITRLICDTYLRENGLAQSDRLSMSSSVEMRLPLIDYRLVETVMGLRKCHKDYELPPKQWLKDAAKGLLPDFVLNRPKRGFTPPVKEWFANLLSVHGHVLRDGYLVQCGILNSAAISQMLDHGLGANLAFPLWFGALVLESWISSCQSLPGKV